MIRESPLTLLEEVKTTETKSNPDNKCLNLETELYRLHQSIRRCSKCFPRGGNCPVAGTGPAQKGGLFLIGQAPGIREPAAQKNFAWTAGRRLFSWFGTIGISEENIRTHAYITAVTKCYPGKSAHGKGDRKPSPAEVENCAPYLEKALKHLSPSVLVLIGGLAIERFLGPCRFSEVIGKEFEKKLAGGKAWVIPVPHPSGASPWPYLPGNKQKLKKAFRLIKGRLQRQKLFHKYLF
jgi:uracil-DNA glycosylase